MCTAAASCRVCRIERPLPRLASSSERIWLPESEKRCRTPAADSASTTRCAPVRVTPASLHPAARGHRPYHLDLPLPHPVDLVHHVGDHAAVVGDHVDHLAHLRPIRA